MARQQASLRLTDLYRARMVTLREQVMRAAARLWAHVSLEDLDGTYGKFFEPIVAQVEQAQRSGVIISSAYLQAFIMSELGHRTATQRINTEPYVGMNRSGEPLTSAYLSPLIAVKAALQGPPIPPAEALNHGLERAKRAVGVDTDHAIRSSLTDAMAEGRHVEGWRRVPKGTSCGACLGLTGKTFPPGTPMDIHPNDDCISEPVVRGVPDIHPRPSGQKIFEALSKQAQDAALGPEAATKVREGEIELSDLVAVSALATADDFITQATPGGRDG